MKSCAVSSLCSCARSCCVVDNRSEPERDSAPARSNGATMVFANLGERIPDPMDMQKAMCPRQIPPASEFISPRLVEGKSGEWQKRARTLSGPTLADPPYKNARAQITEGWVCFCCRRSAPRAVRVPAGAGHALLVERHYGAYLGRQLAGQAAGGGGGGRRRRWRGGRSGVTTRPVAEGWGHRLQPGKGAAARRLAAP